MPMGDIVGGALAGVMRALGSLLLELVLEILIRGPGYLVCRIFRKDVDPDSGGVLLTGLALWALVGGAACLGLASLSGFQP